MSADLVYLVLAVSVLVLTGFLIALAVQLMQAIQDLRRIAQNVEQITALAERVAQATFPGLEHLAKGVSKLERKAAAFLEKKADQLSE